MEYSEVPRDFSRSGVYTQPEVHTQPEVFSQPGVPSSEGVPGYNQLHSSQGVPDDTATRKHGVVQIEPNALQEGVLFPEFSLELSPPLPPPHPLPNYSYSPPPQLPYSYTDSFSPYQNRGYYYEGVVVPHPSPLTDTTPSLTPLMSVQMKELEEEEGT